MVVQCCVCKSIRENGAWHKPSRIERLLRGASHGYCPECASLAYAEIRALHAAKVPAQTAKASG